MTTDSPENTRPVRVRIAPSPTGDPHVGTAYIALFNYVFARKHGGKFVLRIEDTDRARSRADSERIIMDALRWVGLQWDEGPDVGGPHGPYRQSERSDIYRTHAQKLIDGGHAYRCFCTSERLAELREQQKGSSIRGYDRKCRAVAAADSVSRAEAGEAHVVRLIMPTDGTTRYTDYLRGEVEFDNSQLDDQVLVKSDGFPTYHLANVVDDRAMEISHVIRGEEWISSTPKHVMLYKAFGWPEPVWIHMPLLRNEKKSKLSKRRDPVSINYYRDIGVMPEVLLNFLGIMGWSFGGDREKFTLQEMIDVFSWDRISLGGPVFNMDKLRWLNEQYIHDLSYEQLADRIIEWGLNRERLIELGPLIRERIKLLNDFVPATDFFFSGDIDYTHVEDKLRIADVANKDLRKGILALVAKYDALDGWGHEAIERVSREFCDEIGWKTKHAFMLLRLLVTGRKASPPLFTTIEAVGKELTRRRLRKGAELIGKRK